MASKTVRYQVLKPVFVNGSLIDPKAAKGGGPVYVMAAEGLEGSALKLAPEKKVSGVRDQVSQTPGPLKPGT